MLLTVMGPPVSNMKLPSSPPLYMRQMMATDIQLQRLLSPSTTFALLPFHFSTPMDPASLLTDIPTLIVWCIPGYNLFKDAKGMLRADGRARYRPDYVSRAAGARRQSGGQREGSSVCFAAELQNELGSVGARFESVSQSKIQVYLQDMLQVGSVRREENQSALRRSEAKFWEFLASF